MSPEIKDLASLTVRVPRLADQRKIGQRLIAFKNAIQSHRSVASCLEELRDVDLVVTFADTRSSQTGDTGTRLRMAKTR
jgi:hypothetical protein